MLFHKQGIFICHIKKGERRFFGDDKPGLTEAIQDNGAEKRTA
jgi:hypothetical protein